MDFKTAVMNVDSIDYKVALWDTAGAERFRSLTPSFYRKALGAILVYDITNRNTLVKLEAWLEELNSYSDNPNIAIIVVGNKIDKDRVVDREEGRKFARKHRALFIETSAKCDQFVSDAFKDIVEKVSRLFPPLSLSFFVTAITFANGFVSYLADCFLGIFWQRPRLQRHDYRQYPGCGCVRIDVLLLTRLASLWIIAKLIFVKFLVCIYLNVSNIISI